jgi:hypothetical protein
MSELMYVGADVKLTIVMNKSYLCLLSFSTCRKSQDKKNWSRQHMSSPSNGQNSIYVLYKVINSDDDAGRSEVTFNAFIVPRSGGKGPSLALIKQYVFYAPIRPVLAFTSFRLSLLMLISSIVELKLKAFILYPGRFFAPLLLIRSQIDIARHYIA